MPCESQPAIDDPMVPYVASFSNQKRREENEDGLATNCACRRRVTSYLGTQRALSLEPASESIAEIIFLQHINIKVDDP